MSSWRESLLASRKGLGAYAQTLADYPTAGFAVIKELAIAPIKGLGMLPVDQAYLTAQGMCISIHRTFVEGCVIYDRSLMLARRVEGKPWQFERFSQRQEPALALIRPQWSGSSYVNYAAPDMKLQMVSPMDLDKGFLSNAVLRMTSKDDTDLHNVVAGRNQELTDWIQAFLKKHRTGDYDPKSVEVVRMPMVFERPVTDKYAGYVRGYTTLTDCGQLLITSEATLAWMNERMAAEVSDFQPVMMDAFRPNIVLGGLPPNLEDVIGRLSRQQWSLKFGAMCTRCPVTTVTQEIGKKREDKQPLTWLAFNRPAAPESNEATFGVYYNLDAEGVVPIAVGDVYNVHAKIDW